MKKIRNGLYKYEKTHTGLLEAIISFDEIVKKEQAKFSIRLTSTPYTYFLEISYKNKFSDLITDETIILLLKKESIKYVF